MSLAAISLSTILLESASVTLIMKNLSHFVPANSYLLNAGFFLEFIEILSKAASIGIILILTK